MTSSVMSYMVYLIRIIFNNTKILHACMVLQAFHSNMKQFSPVWDWRSAPPEWLSITRDLDLGSGHTAYDHASVIDLYLHGKFHWNRKNFFVDGL